MIREAEQRVESAEDKLAELREDREEAEARVEALADEIATGLASGRDKEELEELRQERSDLVQRREDLEQAIEIASEELQARRERLTAARFDRADRESGELAEEAADAGREALRAAVDAVEAFREWKDREGEADRTNSRAGDLYTDLQSVGVISVPDPVTRQTGYVGNPLCRGHQRARNLLGLHQRSERRTAMQALQKLTERLEQTLIAENHPSIEVALGLEPDED